MRIAVADAKAQFSELIRRAEAGETVELTRYGRPVARITAAGQEAEVPLVGALSGRILWRRSGGDAERQAEMDPPEDGRNSGGGET